MHQKLNNDTILLSAENNSDRNNALTMMLETDVDSNEYEVATSNEWPQEGYIFNASMSACEKGSKLIWNEEAKTVNIKTNVSDKCYVYFDKEPEIIYLADYIKSTVYTGDGNNGLYYHDGVGNYENADQEAGDNSYRYAGTNPNNYVCFGSDEATCPNDNLYRIIGVFNRNVKLIKNSFLGEAVWDTKVTLGTIDNLSDMVIVKTSLNETDKIIAAPDTGYGSGINNWSESLINSDINGELFLDILDVKYSNLISNYTWQVGGMSSTIAAESDAQTVFNYEVGINSSDTIYESKIGLMYVSDYYYAASPTYWSYPGDINLSNWMHLGESEWTITRNTDNTTTVFHIYNSASASDVAFRLHIRPTFYLNSDVKYISGNGELQNPYRIS